LMANAPGLPRASDKWIVSPWLVYGMRLSRFVTCWGLKRAKNSLNGLDANFNQMIA